MKQPDILLIILDTQRRDHLSTYQYARETAPNLDHFTRDATRFNWAVAPAQWTIPVHASMFTGLYAAQHHVVQGYHQLSGMNPTLAEILHGAGYHTVGFCNNPLVGVLDNGLQRGFERFYNYAGATANRPFRRLDGPLVQAIAQRWHRFARPTQNRFAHSEKLFRISMNPLLVPLWTRFINYKGNSANSLDDLIAYLTQHRVGGAQQPLFTFLNLMGTHLPYRPPQLYLDRVGVSPSRTEYSFMHRFNSEAARWATPTDPPLTDWQQQTLYGFYDAEILHQDTLLGRLFDYLRQSGALDDTLIIIAADHGEAHGDHEQVGHSFVVNQELVHVPLIIRDPEGRFPHGATVETTVSTRRIFHTVLAAAGITPPLDEADPNADVDRLTLAKAIPPQQDPEQGIAFSEAYPPTTIIDLLEHNNPAIIEQMRLRLVRRGVYQAHDKLTVAGDHIEALYDTVADPYEYHDLSAQRPTLAQHLLHHVQGFMLQHQTADEAMARGEIDPTVADNLRALGYIE